MSQTAPCTDTDIRQDACSAFLAPCRAQKKGVGLFHPHTFVFFFLLFTSGAENTNCPLHEVGHLKLRVALGILESGAVGGHAKPRAAPTATLT